MSQSKEQPPTENELARLRDDLLAHPEALEILSLATDTLVKESDRGAVLIAAEIVSGQLKKMLWKIASPHTNHDFRKELLKGIGPLSTFSAKAKVSLFFGLLDANTYRGIEKLRKLRNRAAHSEIPFDLGKHRSELAEIMAFGTGAPVRVARDSHQIVFDSIVDRMWEEVKSREVDDEIGPLYESRADVEKMIDGMWENDAKGFRNLYLAKSQKVMLGLSTAVICGNIIYLREKERARMERE